MEDAMIAKTIEYQVVIDEKIGVLEFTTKTLQWC